MIYLCFYFMLSPLFLAIGSNNFGRWVTWRRGPELEGTFLFARFATQYSPTSLPRKGSRLSRNVVTLLGCTCRLMPTLWFSRRSVLLKALISGCWLFGNRCLKLAKDFRHQTQREVERHSPFLPQIQLLNSLSLARAAQRERERGKLHEENQFNCIVLVFAIHCFWQHHVDRRVEKNRACFYVFSSCRLHGNV